MEEDRHSRTDSGADSISTAAELLPLVYDQLRRLAAARLAREKPGQTLQATALVHEAWIRLENSRQKLCKNEQHFFAIAARAMRQILVENARRKARRRLAEGGDRVSVDEIEIACPLPDSELLALDEALDELAAAHPLAADLVSLRFFTGLTQAEAAEQLGISRTSADRTWLFARSWLYSRIRLPEERPPKESPSP